MSDMEAKMRLAEIFSDLRRAAYESGKDVTVDMRIALERIAELRAEYNSKH